MTRLSVTGIASDVASGRQSAVSVAREVLAQLEAYDQVQPQAWISRVPPDEILAQAAEIDRRVAAGEDLPLAGVPFAVKDNIDATGLATTVACPAFAYAPAANAHVVDRVLAAGALLIGKTNLDQFATGLNGTRSPFGAPRCVYNSAYISGGSSSGSAVATAAGLVAFAFGTDTAGSGRVPAAFNHLIGLKPSKGRWSSRGLVPACRTLDCITVFTSSLEDAERIDDVVAGFDAGDDYSKPRTDIARPMRRVGVARPDQLNWCGDAASEALYRAAAKAFQSLDCELVEIDLAPLSAAAALLYNGPWVAERTAALENLLRADPEAFDPTVRTIVAAGLDLTAVDVFRGEYALAGYRRAAERMWSEIDVLLLPTAPTIYRVVEMLAAPIALNASLGLYTNFVNLLDMAALNVPAGFRDNGTGFGVTLIGPASTDRALIGLAQRYEQTTHFTPPPLDKGSRMDTVKLAVVGAHLENMPLHWQLTSRQAKALGPSRTAASYRLYAMANTTPPKPALIFDPDGASIAVEVYELSFDAFGSFVAEVPAPLAIGTVTLEDGSQIKGFVAEPRAMVGATDITHLGGWRAYIASLAGK